MRPLWRRMVSASSSACVGCSCAPSPALTTEQSTLRARRCTAPAAWWRTTMMSGRMALSVAAVSISVSPFFTEEEATDMFMTSAPSRLPAISKEDWVRVEGSKNRLICVRPRRVAFFFSICRLTSTASSARSSKASMSHGDRPSIPSRWRCGIDRARGGHAEATAIGSRWRRARKACGQTAGVPATAPSCVADWPTMTRQCLA